MAPRFLLGVVALLSAPFAHASLHTDGVLGVGFAAPTYPSLYFNVSTYVASVVNVTAWTNSSLTGLGYSNASVILDWNEQVAKALIAGSPLAPTNSSYLFDGDYAEQPLNVVASSRLLALLNLVMYETVLLFQNGSVSSYDPYNPADGSCPARVLAVNSSAICPRYVALKDLSNGVPALAASYGAHALLTALFQTRAGSGGSSLGNIKFDATLKNHQQWFNLQWSKAENNPGWAIGYSKSALANTSSACPGQVNFCSPATAAAQNKTVTTASQNIGTFVANAVLASRFATDGFAEWSPLSLSLNNPLSTQYNSTSPYQLTHNNNATIGASNPLVAITSTGDLGAAALNDGANRSKYYSDAELDFAPYGSSTSPGVQPYSLSPQLGTSAKGFIVQSSTYASLVAGLWNNTADASVLASNSNGAMPLTYAATSAPANAFFWRLGGGSLGLGGHFNTIAAFLLNNASTVFSLQDTARLHAQLHLAIADAQAAAWSAKESYLSPRPETVYGVTVPGWRPLLANPPYPAFPSAHATTCGAAVGVLRSFFGGVDALPLTNSASSYKLTSSDSYQLTVSGSTPATSPATKIARAYTTFSQLAAECAQSRVDGGVQFPFSAAAGSALGAQAATDVLATYPGPSAVDATKVWSYLSSVAPGPAASGGGRSASMAASALITLTLLALSA